MKRRTLGLFFASASLGFAPAAAGSSSGGTDPRLAPQQPTVVRSLGASKHENKSASSRRVYVVQLEHDAVATYDGGIPGLAATSCDATGDSRLDVRAPASIAYADFLRAEQTKFEANCDRALNRRVRTVFRYRHAFNGVAIELAPDEAAVVRRLPGVVRVDEEVFDVTMTDSGPHLIGAPRLWRGNDYHPGTRGEGTVLAVLDGGLNSDHPSFADIGGDGYDHTNPLGSGNYIPGSHCDTTDPSFCNDKVIGAWAFVDPSRDAEGPEDETRGHGTHVAGTAAGNVIRGAGVAAPTDTLVRDISGVAPHANIIVYDVCDPTGSCPSSALLAGINQAVIDASVLPNGIQALNYSISGGNDPYNHSRELALLNAVAAGIYVATSAGNNGPDPRTTGHNSPWVSATGALTHRRNLPNTLNGLSSDGLALSDLVGAGLTGAYGPARIVHARDFPTANGSENDTAPGRCIDPFPPGTWNGEIVACDRGGFSRVGKGANVFAGGAGGYVLINLEANGETVNSDAHVLPAVHLGATEGAALSEWLETETNTFASISGFKVDVRGANADVMGGFSSRGPNSAIDILKPDVAAPGVNVLAPDSRAEMPPEFGIRSGTSMASPHHSGAALLIRSLVDWTPPQVKSALMMTAQPWATKEDNSTAADPFDIGAGRINIRRALDVGLVLNETAANFTAANPEIGGDPKTVNIASMQDGACVHECSWTRTVQNVSKGFATWDLQVRGAPGTKLSVMPHRVTLDPGETAQITVHADTALAARDWSFGRLRLRRRFGGGPTLRMPIAILPADTTLPGVFTMAVDRATAVRGETLTYTVRIRNGALEGEIAFDSLLGRELTIVPGSLTSEVSNGTTLESFTYDAPDGRVKWRGSLAVAGFDIEPSGSPAGYVSLRELGVAPAGCPEDCDDGAFFLQVPSFVFNGEPYDRVTWSVNGVLEAGDASGDDASGTNRRFPDSRSPNNILAPFWADLNLEDEQAEWYTAVVDIGSDQYSVYEWENVPHFRDNSLRYTFQVWVQNGPVENIWFVYQRIDSVTPPRGASVGVENRDASVGTTHYFEGEGTAPQVGVDLKVRSRPTGEATLTFQAVTERCRKRGTAVVQTGNLLHAGGRERAVAVTRCRRP